MDKEKHHMPRLVVVSNRVGIPSRGKSAAGGLAVALSTALRQNGGVWFGWSGEVATTPECEPKISRSRGVTYATLDLSPDDYEAYYSGFANQTLWPLFHYRTGLAATRKSFAQGYYRVNNLFAHALLPLLRPDDLIWVHDYHLVPLGHELRQLGCKQRLGFFLHIPWPAAEVLYALPGHAELVKRMFAYDVVGFQTPGDVRSFIDYVVLEAKGSLVGPDRVRCFGREITIKAFPIGCDAQTFAESAAAPRRSAHLERIHESIAGRSMLIGVDRLDYSKGLDRRLRSFALLLERWPEFHRQIFMLQIAPTTRADVPEYGRIRRELEALSGKINGRHAHFDWVPVRYVNQAYSLPTLASLYRASRVALVTPVRDGMNLVAKEYVASQDPENPGVLVLSRFAGAAHQMRDALIVNPFDEEEMAEAIRQALKMPLPERISRWRTLMEGVLADDVHAWWRSFLAELAETGQRNEGQPDPAADETQESQRARIPPNLNFAGGPRSNASDL